MPALCSHSLGCRNTARSRKSQANKSRRKTRHEIVVWWHCLEQFFNCFSCCCLPSSPPWRARAAVGLAAAGPEEKKNKKIKLLNCKQVAKSRVYFRSALDFHLYFPSSGTLPSAVYAFGGSGPQLYLLAFALAALLSTLFSASSTSTEWSHHSYFFFHCFHMIQSELAFLPLCSSLQTFHILRNLSCSEKHFRCTSVVASSDLQSQYCGDFGYYFFFFSYTFLSFPFPSLPFLFFSSFIYPVFHISFLCSIQAPG